MSDSRETRWRPRWAVAVAVLGLVICAVPVYGGSSLVWQDAQDHGEWLDGVGFAFGGLILGGVALIAGPWAVFLARGGRGWFGGALIGAAVVAVGWLVIGVLPEM